VKNIAVLTQNYPPSKGGMAVSCQRIVKNLRKNGNIVHVLHFQNRNENYEVKTELNGNYTSLAVHDSEEFTLSLANLFLETNLTSFNFDIVVAFGGYLPLLWAPIVSKLYNKPLYTCIRGNDFDEFLFSKRRQILFYALENSNYTLSVSLDKAIKIKKLFPNVNSEYTPNGINIENWTISNSQIEKVQSYRESADAGKTIILIAGQLKPKKGINQFLESFSYFYHKTNYEVWLVGDVSETTQEILFQLPFVVKCFPYSNKEELKFLYHASDIICIPSFYEGMPNVLLEAGACKKLVIASKIAGITDIIENKVSGILYNPLNKLELIDAFITYENLKSTNSISTLQETLYQKISNFYSEEDEIRNYLKFI